MRIYDYQLCAAPYIDSDLHVVNFIVFLPVYSSLNERNTFFFPHHSQSILP